MKSVRIGLIGDHDPAVTAHRAIPLALTLASAHLGRTVEPTWFHTGALAPDVSEQLAGCAGIWCVPASPYANTSGALAAIRFARESGRPFLGTCGGFQHALLEFAHNLLGRREVEHAETAPDTAHPLVARLTCSLVERSGRIAFADGSRLRAIYGTAEAEEAYHCNYGLNPRFEELFQGSALQFSGRDPANEVRALELPTHPFFIATLFQPERSALRGEPHPLVTAFASAASAYS